ncbi:hypothetical protein [Leptospirillum ferrooxidans]|uniref:Uncharacterized protein n=1 Tax=Leptospirillum ferrooxidans (strain C2-3) TaxID=1162668 RepID=I0IMR8_LEPFC|nr:hypothetical protein [Leptospirillum ferrooxidans]BAM06567.1 hypothetical protein LFE_0858 [Leptospirillum ferrooxidans C2-3]
MRFLIVVLIFIVIGLGYLLAEKKGKDNQFTQLGENIGITSKGVSNGKEKALESVKKIRVSLLLRLTENSIEIASRDLLDKNFGKANEAVVSALGDINSIKKINKDMEDLNSVKNNLEKAESEIKSMNADAINTLLIAQSSIRSIRTKENNSGN